MTRASLPAGLPAAPAIYQPQSCRDTHTATELQLCELLCRYELLSEPESLLIITVTLMGSWNVSYMESRVLKLNRMDVYLCWKTILASDEGENTSGSVQN